MAVRFGTGWSRGTTSNQGLCILSLYFWIKTATWIGLETQRCEVHLSGSPFRFADTPHGGIFLQSTRKTHPKGLTFLRRQLPGIDLNILTRQYTLLSPRLPRLHSIKGPCKLVLGGILTHPRRSRTRKTEFKLIERLPDILRGQFRFQHQEEPVYRSLTLRAGPSSTGAWRKVFTSPEYPRLVFKLSPATEDLTYTTEEIRAFRQIPGYTAQLIQEFHTYLTLSEDNGANGRIGTVTEVYFHVLICERLIPYAQTDFTGMDPGEIA